MAGGKGTRIAALNADVPKPMIDICGKPILQWQIECLARQGLITIVVGYKGEVIRTYFSDGAAFGVNGLFTETGATWHCGSIILPEEFVGFRLSPVERRRYL